MTVHLSLAGISVASFQAVDKVAWLGVVSWFGWTDWQLCEKDGTVCLVVSKADARTSNPDDEARRWVVSAPAIKDTKGRFLGSDPEGRNPEVRLLDKAGENTRWVFEIVDRIQPGRKIEEGKSYKVGPSGYTFRAKLADGPYKGWYLSADKPAAKRDKHEDKAPAVRAVKLVRGVREAMVFTYIEANYSVGSK